MTSRDFAYWLQGFFEVSQAKEVTPEQLTVIKNHLNMVFRHEIDPSHGDAAHLKTLSDIHRGMGGAGLPASSGGGAGAPSRMGPTGSGGGGGSTGGSDIMSGVKLALSEGFDPGAAMNC